MKHEVLIFDVDSQYLDVESSRIKDMIVRMVPASMSEEIIAEDAPKHSFKHLQALDFDL